ncbi:CARDB domain-containing protein, partial [Ulvibacter litoralis]
MKKILLFLFLCLSYVSQGQEIQLFQQFNGQYDFTAFGNTLNLGPNGQGSGPPCDILTESSADLLLLPGQTFVSAHLYWAGHGNGDLSVKLNGNTVTAQRTFGLTYNGLPYFAAYADVSGIVALNGNATYTLADLDLTSEIAAYCDNTNFGGWAIYVIYEDPTLTLNQISLFDGLDYVASNKPSLGITLTNIEVATDDLAKIGFLAWEGESFLANNETLQINGNLISNPPLNPANNAFNNTNSYTNSSVMWNMDLDYYDLQDIVQPGDTSINIDLTSSQDFVMVNNIITSVNSEIPDATIEIDNVGVLCENNDIDVNYTVYNVNSTAPLPLGTPIAFYANAVLLGQTQTVADIPINGSEAGTITLNIPLGTPVVFDLIAVVDDIGNGTGIVSETDETNNEFILEIDLEQAGLDLGPNIESCVGMTVTLDTGIIDPNFTFQWFRNGVLISGATGPSVGVTTDGTYTVEAFEGVCFVSGSIDVHFNPQPIANPPVNLYQCDDGVSTGFFDLTENDDDILGAQDPTLFVIKYYESFLDSQNDVGAIAAPTFHQIVAPSPQTIYVRIEDNSGTCFALEDFEIYFTVANAGVIPSPFDLCDQDEDGSESINLPSEFDLFILNGEDPLQYNITYHLSQAEADANTGALPVPYFVNVPGETIYVRLENIDDVSCYDTTQTVFINVDIPPVVNGAPEPLVICDGNNDGFAFFTLHDADVDITLGDPDLIVTYHPTQSDAENNLNELLDPYANDDPYNDVVFARIESVSNTCYNTTILNLEVRNTPEIVAPADPLRLC